MSPCPKFFSAPLSFQNEHWEYKHISPHEVSIAQSVALKGMKFWGAVYGCASLPVSCSIALWAGEAGSQASRLQPSCGKAHSRSSEKLPLLLLWSTLIPAPVGLAGGKPRIQLLHAPIPSPCRCRAQRLVADWGHDEQERRRRCLCALNEGSGAGHSQAEYTLVWWKSVKSQLVRNVAYSYAFLEGWDERLQQDSSVFVMCLSACL